MSNQSVLFDAPGPKARRASLISSIIAGVVIVLGLGWMAWTLAQPKESGGITLPGYFDPSRWDIFADPEVWSYIIFEGVLGTLRAALTASVLAIILGIILSLLRSSEVAWIRIPTAVVLEFVRGMPVLLMMLFILLVLNTGAFWAVVAALPRGQREAGLSLGMRPLQSKMLVEFPQAFRQMLPIIVAQLVVLLKDTSLGYIVGYTELLRVNMNQLASFYGNRYLFSFFIVTLVLYLIMNLSLSWFARWLSRRTASTSAGRRLDPEDPGQAVLVAEASASAQEGGRAR